MHSADTATRVPPIEDRLDTLLLGSAQATRHRILRMLDPAPAAELRAAAYSKAPKGRASAPAGRPAAVRARVAALLGTSAVELETAA